MIKVAEPTIERLVQYHRLLERVQNEGQRVISSQQMGDLLGIKASQVRKDLSYFGEIGKRGVGYHVGRLYEHVFRILASPKTWRVALAGAGNLGLALIGHSAFKNQNFCVEALFDVDPQKVNKEIAGVHCWHFDEMTAQLQEKKIPRLQQARPFYREAVLSGFFKRSFKPFDFLQMTGQILKFVGLFFIPDNLIIR